MNTRYSQLQPFTHDEKKEIAKLLCSFFAPLNNQKHREKLGLPIESGKLRPLTFFDFLTWSKKIGYDLNPKMFLVKELSLALENKGFLVNAGNTGQTPGFSTCYYFMKELSTIQQKGTLWLGSALGAGYIGNEIKKDIVLIIGKTKQGDCAVGTGLLIAPGKILTCAHVLDDMKVDDHVEVHGAKFNIDCCLSHKKVDVGLILLQEKVDPFLKDKALRCAHSLEEVVISGYPTVPRSLVPTITLHRGEICGRMEETMDGYPLELFSAIARPGNSGGPVIGLDGHVVGIVTRSLERPREDADAMAPLPFFSAVPSDVIMEACLELTPNERLPWEDYQ